MRVDPAKNFGTRECPGCACEVEANNNRCPICGYEFPDAPEAHRSIGLIGGIIIGLLIAGILYALTFAR